MPDNTETTVVTQTTVDDAAALEAIDAKKAEAAEAPADEEKPAEGEDKKPEDETGAEESGADESQEADSTEIPIPEAEPFEFEGVQIDPTKLEVPDEFVAGLKNQGLDGATVAAEMHSAEGLSKETKEKLYAEFGKSTVDLFVRSQLIETRNEIEKYKSQQSEAEVVQSEINTAVSKELGEGLDFPTLAKWAASTVSPSERAELNADLSSGRKSTVLRTIRDLKSRYQAANGEGKPNLVDGSNDEQGVDNSPMSAAEYNKAIVSREYYKNPALYDARRNAGLSAGL